MYISKVQIGNYKSNYESPVLELKPGFNIIVGKNNVGKTALLEALSLKIKPNAHRSPKTVPSATSTPPREPSWVDMCLTISSDELIDLFLDFPDRFEQIRIPLPANAPQFGSPGERDEFYVEFIRERFEPSEFTFTGRFKASPIGQPGWTFPTFPAFGDYRGLINTAGQGQFMVAQLNPATRKITHLSSGAGRLEQSDFGRTVVEVLADRVYCFKAERFSAGRARHGTDRTLATDASNLPEALGMLQSNPGMFRHFNALIHTILDDVQAVSVQSADDQWLRILVWPSGIQDTREDLASDLDQSGSGVAQVLSILYVAMTARRPQTILIDEPQSFLHPGAVRKLLEALKTYPQHQYIISTHSPISLTATNPSTITLVRKDGAESTFEIADPQNAQTLRACLAEVGARLSDVFGADNIIWVEGQTEELCFPKILERIARRSLRGTVIRGMKNTGDLIGKRARLAMNIYKKLSGGRLLTTASSEICL